ncbi:hypothetical protein C8Q78DRAFT_1084068 [Trametes maxima]|nr:hypothetical protein C8Q78DRAFT_1084068 [Trametes maxima]
MNTGAQIGRQQRTPEKREGDEDNEYRHAFLIIEAKRDPNGSSTWHVLCAESDEERDSWVEERVRYATGTYNDGQTPVSSVAGPSPVLMLSVAQSAQPRSSTSSNPPTDLQTTPDGNNAKLFNATAYPEMSASPTKSLAPSISEHLEVGAPLSSSLPVSSPLVEEPETLFAATTNLFDRAITLLPRVNQLCLTPKASPSCASASTRTDRLIAHASVCYATLSQLTGEDDTGYYDDFTSPEDMQKYVEVIEKQRHVERVHEKEEPAARGVWVGFTFRKNGPLAIGGGRAFGGEADGALATIF